MATQGQADAAASLSWYDAQEIGVEGRGWSDVASYFDRLPARAESKVRPPVWDLSHDSAGMVVHFETQASRIAARYTLTRRQLASAPMPATGVSGLDLYALDDAGHYRWVATARPETAPEVNTVLIEGMSAEARSYMLYLPLYNGIRKLEIGVPADASFTGVAPRQQKPIVFYGSSIMQGASASRPGMCHASILGRWLHWPVINLGFSGNAVMEPEIAELLAELDPLVYVLDALPNMTSDLVTERAEAFIRALATAHPQTPIVLVEDRTYPDGWVTPARRQRNDTNRTAFLAVYRRLLKAGLRGLKYVQGEYLLGEDGEGTVDGSHPTDLGFHRQAETLDPVLRPLVEAAGG